MTTVTPLPTPVPSRQDPINFSTRADSFLGALPTFGTELNLVAGEVNTNATNASTAASTATIQAGIATTQAGIATTKASEATTARNEAVALTESYQGSLSSDPMLDKNGNPLSDGDWYVNSSTGLIRVYTGGVWATSVSATAGVNSINSQQGNVSLKTINTNSLLGTGNIDTTQNLPRSARTSNLQITVSDKGTLIDITSGTFTQTFDAAATLGNGWFCYIRNSGTGDITLDPNAGETIDGVVSGVMKPAMVLLVQCDGAAFSVVRIDTQPIMEVLTSGTRWVCPIGVRRAKLRMTGGGASGYGAAGSTGGGAGGYLEKLLSVTPGTSYTYAVGSGGSGVSSGPGINGGASIFVAGGVTYLAGGGTCVNQDGMNPGGNASNGDINIKGGAGTQATSGVEERVPSGGANPLSPPTAGYGSVSGNGIGYGGGGAPKAGAALSGSGAPGVLILEY